MSILSINGSDVYERETERNWAAEYAKRLVDAAAEERDAAIAAAVEAEENARTAAIAAEEAARVSKDNALADGTALENNSIYSRHIREGGVTAAKLADHAVTYDKLEASARTGQRISSGNFKMVYADGNDLDSVISGNFVSSILDIPIKDEWAREQVVEQSDTLSALRAGLVTGSVIGNGAVKLKNLSTDLTYYSTTPQQVGTWSDGTPIWRAAVDHTLSADDIADASYNVLDDLTNARESVLFVLGGRACLTNETPSCVDTINCVLEPDGNFIWNAQSQSESQYTQLVGYIEFVTPTANIKP